MVAWVGLYHPIEFERQIVRYGFELRLERARRRENQVAPLLRKQHSDPFTRLQYTLDEHGVASADTKTASDQIGIEQRRDGHGAGLAYARPPTHLPTLRVGALGRRRQKNHTQQTSSAGSALRRRLC